MIILIPHINLLNLSWKIQCLFLSNMEPLSNTGKATVTKHSLPEAPKEEEARKKQWQDTITKTHLYKYIEDFTTKKWKISD